MPITGGALKSWPTVCLSNMALRLRLTPPLCRLFRSTACPFLGPAKTMGSLCEVLGRSSSGDTENTLRTGAVACSSQASRPEGGGPSRIRGPTGFLSNLPVPRPEQPCCSPHSSGKCLDRTLEQHDRLCCPRRLCCFLGRRGSLHDHGGQRGPARPRRLGRCGWVGLLFCFLIASPRAIIYFLGMAGMYVLPRRCQRYLSDWMHLVCDAAGW